MRSWFSYPKGVLIIAFSNLWDTFSYYGTQTILVLYLIHIFHFGSSQSYLLYGMYAAMSFSAPILGGIIADRYLGPRITLLLGASLAILGNLVLMLNNPFLFFIGLAVTLVGSGLYKCNSTQILGSLYHQRLVEKEKGFTLLYLAINIGGTLAPLVYGLVVYKFSWNFGFLVSAIGIGISLILLLFNTKIWPTKPSLSRQDQIMGLTGTLLAIAILALCFLDSDLTVIAPILVFVFGVGYLIRVISKTEKEKRKPLFHLLGLCFFCHVLFCRRNANRYDHYRLYSTNYQKYGFTRQYFQYALFGFCPVTSPYF